VPAFTLESLREDVPDAAVAFGLAPRTEKNAELLDGWWGD
jgi:hypothetical protein